MTSLPASIQKTPNTPRIQLLLTFCKFRTSRAFSRIPTTPPKPHEPMPSQQTPRTTTNPPRNPPEPNSSSTAISSLERPPLPSPSAQTSPADSLNHHHHKPTLTSPPDTLQPSQSTTNTCTLIWPENFKNLHQPLEPVQTHFDSSFTLTEPPPNQRSVHSSPESHQPP